VIQITPQMRILVAIEAVDGKKGIDSLARLCQEKLQADPFSGCLFVFRSRRGTSIRILVYDGQGFWLAQKRLSKGRFVWWPSGNEPHAGAAGPSGADAAGRRQPGCDSGAGVAAGERIKIKKRDHVLHLRSIFRSATLRHARPVAVPRSSYHGQGYRLHSPVDGRVPESQPSRAVGETL